MHARLVTVFGGSGFIGRHLVRRLTADGWRVIVAVRDPEGAHFLKPLGDVGQIVPVAADVADPASVARAVHGADAVVNLVGILTERGKRTFRRVHFEGAGNTAKAAAAAGIERVVHISAIGADPQSPSAYARSKAAGEAALREQAPTARILRPSIVFGPEDGFFNLFGNLARLSPVLPLYGGGKTRFQPVYVGDVAQAIVACIDEKRTAGRTYELGGPWVYTFRELMELVLRETNRRRLLLPLPFFVATIQAALLRFLPNPPLTPDQVRQLRIDNVVGEGAETLAELGIEPTNLEVVLPTYLPQYARGGFHGRPKFG